MKMTELPITLTDNACEKVAALMTENAHKKSHFRIKVMGGGCAGFEYGFSLDDQIKEKDQCIDIGYGDTRIPIVIDFKSLPYLKGMRLDYVQDLQGARFSVTNPNATSTCGCGTSFSVCDFKGKLEE